MTKRKHASFSTKESVRGIYMKDNERIRFMGRDSRGAVWAFTINEDPFEEVMLFFTKKGEARGGDYHSYRQYNTILKGNVKFIEKYGDNIELPIKEKVSGEKVTLMKPGDSKAFGPNIPHICISLTDSWMIEFHELPKTRDIYIPYRKIIEEMKKK